LQRPWGWLAPQAAPIAQTAPDVITPAAPSPDQPQLKAMSLDPATVRQSVDQLAAAQEQMTRHYRAACDRAVHPLKEQEAVRDREASQS